MAGSRRFLAQRGRVDPAALPRGPAGRALCRWCSQEVPRGRRSFCSPACVHEWRLRSQPDYMREAVFRRDRGRCSGCGLDVPALERRLSRLGLPQRRAWLQRLGLPDQERSLWEVHHVKAVFEGGGACGLDNLRTLCVRCHHRATRLSGSRR